MARSTGIFIGILLLIIAVLVVFVVYAFAIRPAVTGYATDRQLEGFQYALISIMQQAATCQPVPLTVGNQTINIVMIECLQQPNPDLQ